MTQAQTTHIERAGRKAHWPSLPDHLQERVGTWITHRGLPEPGDVYGFNLGLHVGDNPETVLQRRRQLQSYLGVRAIWMRQVHGTRCVPADELQADTLDVVEADACVSATAHTAAVVMTADCLPVLLVDEAGQRVAAAHCGWKGLLAGVLENSVNALLDMCDGVHLGHDRAVYAWLGPAIGPRSFQVGSEVRDAYRRKHPAFESCFSPDHTGAWLADLYGLAQMTLSLSKTHVMVDCEPIDTLTTPHFNSFRRSPVTGRQASLIWLR